MKTKEDKNGHIVDEFGNLEFDERCAECMKNKLEQAKFRERSHCL